MEIAISAYHQKRGRTHWLSPITPGIFDWAIQSGDLGKAKQLLIERVRKELPKLNRSLFTRLTLPPGRSLTRLHLELVLRGEDEKKRITGHFPLVVDDRVTGDDMTMRVGFHPLRAAEWFELAPGSDLSEELTRHYSRVFAPDDPWELLKSTNSDKLVSLRFQVDAPSLRSQLRSQRDKDDLASSGRSGNLPALLRGAVNQTARAANGTLRLGLPREKQRARLAQLLCGQSKSPVLIVGPPGAGKSSLFAQAVYDMLDADDYAAHRNFDRVHNVLAMSGRQIIAGMSYVGQWEARCVELLERAKKRRLVLWVDDIHAFASIGKTTDSDRVLADFFRGPLARRDLIMMAECTPEQLSLLQHEAPAFAAAFSDVQLDPATSDETMAMLLFESRRLEQDLDIAFEPRSLRTILEQSGSLSGGAGLPGRALGPLKALAKGIAQRGDTQAGEVANIGVQAVLRFFSRQTGLPELLLSPDAVLARSALKRELEQQIMGQDLALEAACDVILSLRSKLCGPGRPYGVFLFTGPTGTGKTELAKCLAEYLYGAPERLLRFDMGELNTADAVARLIGDAFEPDGQLTSKVRAQPFAVLLFDEVEKAHPSVLNLMLQIFEDARLSDARGKVTDFRHTLIILTSNLGTSRRAVRGFSDDAAGQASDIARAVREFFPPELFNRVDRIVPFAPLSVQTAREIVRKELAQLVARPGLSERNTFVRFTETVVSRVVEAGYSAEYGARALKRYVDREVGGALARAITSDAPAEMRLLWMYAVQTEAGIGLQSEALREAEPIAQRSSVHELLEADYAALRERIPRALAALAEFETDGRLTALGAQISAQLERYQLGELGRADQVYNLDSVLSHARELNRRIEARVHREEDLNSADRLRKLQLGDSSWDSGQVARSAALRNGLEPGRAGRGSPSLDASSDWKSALLNDLAEVALLGNLLASAHEPDRHVALVEVLQLSLHHERRRFAKAGTGLCAWLSRAYADARGTLDSAAIVNWDGTSRAVSPNELDDALTLRPRVVTLRLVGPGIFDFLQREIGCQVRRTLASGPEIVRVRVIPGHHEPLAWAEQHLAALAAFERGLEGRGPLHENPEALLPVIRSLRFEPEADRASPLRIEDYRFAHVASRRVRKLREGLAELWLLGASLPSPVLVRSTEHEEKP